MYKVVVITGGTQNIGRAIATKFLENCDTVIIVGRNEERGRNTQKELSCKGNCQFIKADISQEKDCKEIIDKVMLLNGKIDVLVNNAALIMRPVDEHLSNILDMDIKAYKESMDTNVTGSIQMIKYAGRAMVDNKAGVIINMGSVIGTMSHRDMPEYCISKSAVSMLTKCAALQLAPYGVRCVSVCPGWVGTDNNGLIGESSNNLHMRGKALTMAEIADTVFYLASKEASAINGTDIFADDGYSAFKGDIALNTNPYLGYYFRKELSNIFHKYRNVLLFATVELTKMKMILKQIKAVNGNCFVYANYNLKNEFATYIPENRIFTYRCVGKMNVNGMLNEIAELQNSLAVDCILIPSKDNHSQNYDNVYQVAKVFGGDIYWIYSNGLIEKS